MRPTTLAFATFALAVAALVAPLTAHGGPAMEITSPAFAPNGEIPAAHTCEGAPDPKAPKTVWVHWVVYDLPAATKGLPEGGKLPAGAHEGLNDWKHPTWNGPCPPIGRHRYFFKLYALDTTLGDLKKPTKAQLEKAMEGHTLAKAELIGTYQKKAR